MISRQSIILLLLFASCTFAVILDAVPSACTSACRPAASSLENCAYLTCICDEQHGRDLQGCLTCLYRLFPNNETYAAAQKTLQSFQTTCRDKIAVTLNPLNVTSISSSIGTPGSTSLPSSSSSRAPNSTSITVSNSSSTISTPTPTVSSNSTTIAPPSSSSSFAMSSTRSPSATGPPINLGTQQAVQICRLRSDYPSRRIERLTVSGTEAAEAKKPLAKSRTVLAFLAVVVFIPIGVLLVRT